MRVKITLTPSHNNLSLPVNYNYFLTGLIYRTLEKSSEDYSRFLHTDGYQLTNSEKRFKLFAFSRLISDQYRVAGDSISFGKSPVCWHISSPVQEFIEHLVNGVFAEGQQIKIGPQGSESLFIVERLESLSPPAFTATMKFICLSPITVSKTISRSNGSNSLNSSNGLNSLNGSNGLNSLKVFYKRR
jgi:CRISPR-associated endoribonuclease Cas6